MAQQTEQIRTSTPLWYALKRVQAHAPKRLRPYVRTFATLLDAIARGDDELLLLLRQYMDSD